MALNDQRATIIRLAIAAAVLVGAAPAVHGLCRRHPDRRALGG